MGTSETKNGEANDGEVPFEVSLGKLEEIVRQLEEGRLPLSEALARYEEGVQRLRQCYTALKSAERKIELLVGTDSTGNPVTRPFEDAEETLEEKQRSRGSKRTHPGGRNRGADPGAAGPRGMDTGPGLF